MKDVTAAPRVGESVSREDLARFGVGRLAYLQAIELDGQPLVALVGADGRRLAVTPDPRTAWRLAQENDLELVALQ